MDSDANESGGKAPDSHDDAVGDQISALVSKLRTNLEASAPISDAEAKQLRAHHMMISMVVDLETLIAKRRAETREQAGGALDLEAARSEILRRIARFKAAAASSKVS